MSTLHFNNMVPTQNNRGRFEWIADGTQGSALLNGNTLELSLHDEPHQKQVWALENPPYPIAFAAAMGELMNALAENRAPQTRGRDNLNSIAIAYAAVESSESGQAVTLKSESTT